MARPKRRLPKSVDDVIWNILVVDLGKPWRIALGLVKNVFYPDVNDYTRYDPRDGKPSDRMYEDICRVFKNEGYVHYKRGKVEYWQLSKKSR